MRRTPHKTPLLVEHKNNTNNLPQPQNPPRRRMAQEDSFCPVTQPLTTSQTYIQSHYNKNTDENWTLDTTFFDKKLGEVGLVCSPVEARGNCGYQAIIKSACIPHNFLTLKRETLDFFNANNKAILQFQRAGWVTEDMDTFSQRIQHSLITDWVYANHADSLEIGNNNSHS
jgi:hypothetical protein